MLDVQEYGGDKALEGTPPLSRCKQNRQLLADREIRPLYIHTPTLRLIVVRQPDAFYEPIS